MSTLTDLFNIRIGLSKKGVIIEKLWDNYTLVKTDEKIPVKEKVEIRRYYGRTFEDILDEEGIIKENIYYIISPHQYYRNTLNFPFSERQKIESVIKYEVSDFLPSQDFEYLTDFYTFEKKPSVNEVLSFTIDKDEIKKILESFGKYRENLKAVIPFDIAVFHSLTSLLDMDTFIFLDLQDDSVYIQYIKDRVLKNVVYIRKDDTGRYRNSLVSGLLMLLKASDYPIIYLNIRQDVKDDFRNLTNEVLEEIGSSYRTISIHNYKSFFPYHENFDFSDMIAAFGILKSINETKGQRVNLLKEEFLPLSKRYVSIKDCTILGVLLLFLLSFSIVNLLFDIKFKKSHISELERSMNDISMKVFEKPLVKVGETKRILADIQERIRQIHDATDRKFSSAQLLKELSSSLPVDVVLEYTDIMLERGHIKFYGRTQTFSDIDKIRESLSNSDYFSEVEITSTGTTGSGGGFAVTFVFDITVIEE